MCVRVCVCTCVHVRESDVTRHKKDVNVEVWAKRLRRQFDERLLLKGDLFCSVH